MHWLVHCTQQQPAFYFKHFSNKTSTWSCNNTNGNLPVQNMSHVLTYIVSQDAAWQLKLILTELWVTAKDATDDNDNNNNKKQQNLHHLSGIILRVGLLFWKLLYASNCDNGDKDRSHFYLSCPTSLNYESFYGQKGHTLPEHDKQWDSETLDPHQENHHQQKQWLLLMIHSIITSMFAQLYQSYS